MKSTKSKLTKSMKEVGYGDYLVLISYQTPVAAMHIDGKAYRTIFKWSATSSHHISRWLAGCLDVENKP